MHFPGAFTAERDGNGEGNGRDGGSFGGKQERGTNGRRVANFRSVDAGCNEVRY